MIVDEVLPVALAGERLDRVVAMVAGCSRSLAAQLVEGGGVRLNGSAVGARAHRVAAGDRIELELPESPAASPQPDPTVAVPVAYEDPDLVVVDKPAGLVVHPGAGHPAGTLVNGLLDRYPEMAAVGQPDRPGIVHRLDRGTSGLLVVARTPAAYDSLVEQLSSRTAGRRYVALAWGRLDSPRGLVDAPVGRSAREPTRMAVTARGREARTAYEVTRAFDRPSELSLLSCELETGRTHQIRVHLAAIGHPVVGDERYGGARPGVAALSRPFLHAAELRLRHPRTGEALVFSSALPDDLAAALDRLDRLNGPHGLGGS